MDKTLQAVIGSLSGLLVSWRRHLEAENLSPNTIKLYVAAGQLLGDYLLDHGMPVEVEKIGREHIEAFLVDLRERTSASTAATRYRGLRQLFRWLEEEGEIARNPMSRMKPPRMAEKPVPVLADEDLRRLFAIAAGRSFEDRRDLALMRIFLSTGARLDEIATLRVESLSDDLWDLEVVGKGRKSRVLPLSPKARRVLDRYLRARARHEFSETPWLWIGIRGRLTPSGIAQMLRRRCDRAGIDRIHPHQFRHTFSHLWLAGGGNEHDLARLNGWSSTQMVARYAASTAAKRAREAHARLAPGDHL